MAQLNVSRKKISELLSSMQNKKFIIPDYQRPYKWDYDKCNILWDDLKNFYIENISNDKEYFLGTIVTCKVNDGLEIIDGQQRITTLMLLLRAFYQHLNEMESNANVQGLKRQIEPCIWDINPISQNVDDKNKIHIESRVATELDNEIFHNIIRNGNSIIPASLYSSNYEYFYESSKEFASNNPMRWYGFCVFVLNKSIILPIECDEFETGLTIFSTLNDRGMPLSDSDIFKAQIYKNQSGINKEDFIIKWKNLHIEVGKSNITLDDIFRYYTHIIRAQNDDRSREIGLRAFYSKNDYSIFKNNLYIVDELQDIAEFWTQIYSSIFQNNNDNIHVNINIKSLQYLHCLYLYPNDYWKYIVSVFYFKNKNSFNFEKEFTKFLEKLISFLFIKFVEKPTVNYIKDAIFKAYCDIWKGNNNIFKDVELKPEFKSHISMSNNYKIARALILLKAYLFEGQNELINSKFDVEHILPTKWQGTNFNGWNKKDADIYIEKFGNKIVLERQLNIQAGNGFFGKKKEKYSKSKIKEVIALSKYNKNVDNWFKEDILEREENFIDIIYNFFKSSLTND
ncbi:DUF262 domain-containing protein [uncultured Brachyspira sp.]|uniref:DUF262 domain-containing protein n=1 Tax=uncultured Brachyspira sp. TaxID=221953 RepID=UPI0032083F9F